MKRPLSAIPSRSATQVFMDQAELVHYVTLRSEIDARIATLTTRLDNAGIDTSTLAPSNPAPLTSLTVSEDFLGTPNLLLSPKERTMSDAQKARRRRETKRRLASAAGTPVTKLQPSAE